LSIQSLSHVPFYQYKCDFTFQVGSGHYSCPVFVAHFLSPKISRFHRVDPSLCEYVIETPDEESSFEEFLSLGYGSELVIAQHNSKFIRSICRELENTEIPILIDEQFDVDLTSENVWGQYQQKKSFGFDYQKELTYLASHFDDFSNSMRNFQIDDLGEIFSHPSLEILSEDSLYEFLSRHIHMNIEFACLLEFVHFEFLSADTIQLFIEDSSMFLGMLNHAIWDRLCCRLRLPVETRSVQYKSVARPLTVTNSLDGIVAYLTRIGGGNVHDLNVVHVTASSTYAHTAVCAPKNIADLQTDSNFGSSNLPNQWICYDFRDMRIRPTHYTIKSCFDARVNDTNLKQWIVEVSDDGSQWTDIDSREFNNDLNGPSQIRSFPVADGAVCRYIRLRQTGKNHCGNHFLAFSAFEIFGTLLEADKRK
jgi:hypothetical protein